MFYVFQDTMTPEETDADSFRLRRRFSLHHAVAIVCGLIMGTGIFIAPSGVAREAGSSGMTIVLWLIGGIISLLGNTDHSHLLTEAVSCKRIKHKIKFTFEPHF